MRPDGRDDARRDPRLRLMAPDEAGVPTGEHCAREDDLVFDFTGLDSPGLADLALILTARFQSEPGDRVWVRALPATTGRILQALGLDHLFTVLPRSSEVAN